MGFYLDRVNGEWEWALAVGPKNLKAYYFGSVFGLGVVIFDKD